MRAIRKLEEVKNMWNPPFNKKIRILATILMLSLTLYIPISVEQNIIPQASSINLIVETTKQTYCIREPITIHGTYTKEGYPVTEALIAMQILDRRNNTFAYRTISIGNPQQMWAVNITEVKLTDLNDKPITKIKVNSQIRVKISFKNNYLNQLEAVVAYTVYDGTLIPIKSTSWRVTLAPQASQTIISSLYIPEWASPGIGIISSNVYTNEPANGGIPYAPERLDSFFILRNEQLEPSYSPPPLTHKTEQGKYTIYLRTSPDNYAQPGEYKVFIVGTLIPVITKTTATTIYTVQSDLTPPQACFTYYPTKIYQNMTVTFDASSSSAEGYNDIIVRLEWKINDPYNPRTVIVEGNPPNPIITHTFQYPGTFIVELNVTDSEGLWSTTSKPITVHPEFGPKANFTYDPTSPYNGTTITFNATSSTPGWSAKEQRFSPIIQYIWDWGDGTQNVTSTPIITHKYMEPGNYTVTLTVLDTAGRVNATSRVIQVRIYTIPPFPWDVNGDGYVGIDDIFLVATHFGETPEHPNWNPRCDINGDGYIGIDDIFDVARHFGEEAP